MRRLFKTMYNFLNGLYEALYGLVLHSFKSMNRKIRSKFPVWRMKEETSEHVRQTVKVFGWLILPLSLVYFFGSHFVLGENVLVSILWGIIAYVYSNFLPDIPSVFRKKRNEMHGNDVAWYKKYALLLFAPLLIWLLFYGVRLNWKTTDTFHNFRSLIVYGAFLFVVGFFAFVEFPFSTGDVFKFLFFPLCGIAGFLAHLKVDEIW